MNKRVTELIDGIEANLRELVELTRDPHISSFIVNNNFHFCAYNEHNELKIDIWREGKAQNE